jgi:hypothetical protein
MKSSRWGFMATQFDKEVGPENLNIRYMRSTFQNGGPLQPNETFRFENSTHFQKEQQQLLKDYLLEGKKEFDDIETSDLGFKAEFVTFTILIDQILQLFLFDFLLVIVSIVVVFMWFRLHLKNGFMAIMGVSIIFLSFPFTAFVVSGIFRVSYFGYL